MTFLLRIVLIQFNTTCDCPNLTDMDCSNPTPPSNGAVYSSTRMSYFGSRVSYTCQKGYSLIGNLEINNFVTDFNFHINNRITSFNSRVEELQILQVKLYLLPRKKSMIIFYILCLYFKVSLIIYPRFILLHMLPA